ncbi:CPBP family intramembrane glutamic endopeptidase [Chryseobacterium sp. PMSZPI]|uniref:CPBP family intramembrane glutamic endopeptidase n=1 Tax=Chryseobacterium sp. PMSZPI TaxID=1033900 RepID=UPI0039A2D6C5
MKQASVYVKVIFFYILSLVVFATTAGITKKTAYPDLFSVTIAAVFTIIVVIIFIRSDKITLSDIGIRWTKKSIFQFLTGCILGGAMVVIMTLMITNFSPITFEKSSSFDSKAFIIYIPLFFFVACREEITFRTYMLWRLKNNVGNIVSLLIVTIIFILEHILAGFTLKWAIIGSGLGGILFGFAALRTRNIALPIGLHFAWNFTHWALGYKDNTGLFHEITIKGEESQGEFVAFIAYILVMLLGMVFVTTLSRPDNIPKQIS